MADSSHSADSIKPKAGSWIDDHMNRVRIVVATHCDVPLEILLSVGRFDPARVGEDAIVRVVEGVRLLWWTQPGNAP